AMLCTANGTGSSSLRCILIIWFYCPERIISSPCPTPKLHGIFCFRRKVESAGLNRNVAQLRRPGQQSQLAAITVEDAQRAFMLRLERVVRRGEKFQRLLPRKRKRINTTPCRQRGGRIGKEGRKRGSQVFIIA